VSEYIIAKLQDGSFRVTKFDERHPEPAAIYTLRGKKCDCHAGLFNRPCKHIKMVQDWALNHTEKDDVKPR
jgi:hypothetical protein